MKSALLLLLGLVIGGVAGWFVRDLLQQDVRALAKFSFNDMLGDRQVAYISARGSWRGSDLATKVNTVEITCVAAEKNCDLYQADVITLDSGRPWLSSSSRSFKFSTVWIWLRTILPAGMPVQPEITSATV